MNNPIQSRDPLAIILELYWSSENELQRLFLLKYWVFFFFNQNVLCKERHLTITITAPPITGVPDWLSLWSVQFLISGLWV